jgi:hypothetical protein
MAGAIIAGRPVAVPKMTDEAGADEKIVTVPWLVQDDDGLKIGPTNFRPASPEPVSSELEMTPP